MMYVQSAEYDDGHPGVIAYCDEFPGIMGHGATHEEAANDFMDQIDERVLH